MRAYIGQLVGGSIERVCFFMGRKKRRCEGDAARRVERDFFRKNLLLRNLSCGPMHSAITKGMSLQNGWASKSCASAHLVCILKKSRPAPYLLLAPHTIFLWPPQKTCAGNFHSSPKKNNTLGTDKKPVWGITVQLSVWCSVWCS